MKRLFFALIAFALLFSFTNQDLVKDYDGEEFELNDVDTSDQQIDNELAYIEDSQNDDMFEESDIEEDDDSVETDESNEDSFYNSIDEELDSFKGNLSNVNATVYDEELEFLHNTTNAHNREFNTTDEDEDEDQYEEEAQYDNGNDDEDEDEDEDENQYEYKKEQLIELEDNSKDINNFSSIGQDMYEEIMERLSDYKEFALEYLENSLLTQEELGEDINGNINNNRANNRTELKENFKIYFESINEIKNYTDNMKNDVKSEFKQIKQYLNKNEQDKKKKKQKKDKKEKKDKKDKKDNNKEFNEERFKRMSTNNDSNLVEEAN